MTDQTQIKLVKYAEKYAAGTIEMWRDSKEKALGIKETHKFDDQLNFLKEVLSKENSIYLVILEHTDNVIGLMATDGNYINQLYFTLTINVLESAPNYSS